MGNLPFYCLSGLLRTRTLLKTIQVHVRPNTIIQELRLQNQMTDRLLTPKYCFVFMVSLELSL